MCLQVISHIITAILYCVINYLLLLYISYSHFRGEVIIDGKYIDKNLFLYLLTTTLQSVLNYICLYITYKC